MTEVTCREKSSTACARVCPVVPSPVLASKKPRCSLPTFENGCRVLASKLSWCLASHTCQGPATLPDGGANRGATLELSPKPLAQPKAEVWNFFVFIFQWTVITAPRNDNQICYLNIHLNIWPVNSCRIDLSSMLCNPMRQELIGITPFP